MKPTAANVLTLILLGLALGVAYFTAVAGLTSGPTRLEIPSPTPTQRIAPLISPVETTPQPSSRP